MASKGAPLVAKGLLLSLVLIDGAKAGTPAVKHELDQWIARVPECFTSILDSVDPQPRVTDFFSIDRDHFLIIDLSTMKLVDIVVGSAQAAVDEVAPLLGP